MKSKRVKLETVWTQPISRLQILFNQRILAYKNTDLVNKEFLKGLLEVKKTYDFQIQKTIRSITIYLLIMYLTVTGIEFEIPILGFKLKDIPKLLEISTILFSSALVMLGMRFLDSQVHRRIVDSVVAIHFQKDPLVSLLVKSPTYADTYFYYLFSDKVPQTSGSIRPRLLTKIFNFIMMAISNLTIFTLAFAPIGFVMAFVFPKLWNSMEGKVIVLISTFGLLFYVLCILACWLKLPFLEEGMVEGQNDSIPNS